MRDDWQIMKLGELCTIRPPKKEAKEKLSDSEMVSFVPMNNLNIVSKGLTLEESKPLKKVSGSYTYFADGDVLLAKITPCFENGKLGIATGLVNGVGFGSSEFIVFRSKGNVLPDYLYHYFSQASFREEGRRVMSGAVGHKRVPKEFIEEYPLPLPPLAEQERIVAILDKAFEGIDQAIAHTEQNLASARKLFESYLNNIFTQRGDGWVEKKLGEVCGITSSLVNPKEEQFQELPHVGAGNMVSNSKELVDVMTAKEEGLKSGKHTYTTEMVLYSKIRPYLMKVSVPDFEGLCSADVYPLMPNLDLIRREYLFYLLLTKDFTDYAISRSARAGMPKINRTCLFSYEASYPSLPEQDVILSRLNALSNHCQELETLYTQKLESLKELKQSLLQQAFSGELTKEAVA